MLLSGLHENKVGGSGVSNVFSIFLMKVYFGVFGGSKYNHNHPNNNLS